MPGLKETFARWFLPGFMLVSSVTLLIIGVPRFLHELMLVPGTPILYRVNAGEEVSDRDLEILEKSRLDALRFVELPKAYSDLGASYLRRAQSTQSPEDRRKYAEMAVEVSMKSLNMAPLNTFAWFRVATANVLLGPDHYDKALEAWRASISSARFEPFILLQRFHLGTILYQNMTMQDIELLQGQLGLAYKWDSKKLAYYMHQNNLAVWVISLSEPQSEIYKYFSPKNDMKIQS